MSFVAIGIFDFREPGILRLGPISDAMVNGDHMPLFLKPHTAEWFAALEMVAPHQAAHTRHIIRLAGRDDVCSICGDVESADYKVASEQSAPGIVDTLRLCSDCVKIRKETEGEVFYPLGN